MKKIRDYFFSYYKDSNFLRFKQFFLERDLLRIAFSLFDAEKKIKEMGYIDKIQIHLSKQTYRKIDHNKLIYFIKEILLLILLEDINVELIEIDDIKRRVYKPIVFSEKDAIVLFSAGVDSYSGIEISKKYYDNLLGLFVAHNDQTRIIKIVEDFKPNIMTEIRTLYAPSMGSTGYSQLRGFLYILSAGVYANLYKAKHILVTECGPTMYQPMFSPYDEITYTTHPYVLQASKAILSIFFKNPPKIVLPFENLTKAEVISNSDIKDFSHTHSCISQRFGDHDGVCFGCVIKKLSAIVSDVIDVHYRKDIFSKVVDQNNLMNLLDFSFNLIYDYENMPLFQNDKIIEFNKKDLFYRFALDNICGLYISLNRNHTLYKRFVRNETDLKNRIRQVRKNINKPNFNTFV